MTRRGGDAALSMGCARTTCAVAALAVAIVLGSMKLAEVVWSGWQSADQLQAVAAAAARAKSHEIECNSTLAEHGADEYARALQYGPSVPRPPGADGAGPGRAHCAHLPVAGHLLVRALCGDRHRRAGDLTCALLGRPGLCLEFTACWWRVALDHATDVEVQALGLAAAAAWPDAGVADAVSGPDPTRALAKAIGRRLRCVDARDDRAMTACTAVDAHGTAWRAVWHRGAHNTTRKK